jgi:hypothetical protein
VFGSCLRDDAVHALANIMDFGGGVFVEDTDAIFFEKLIFVQPIFLDNFVF